MYKSEFFTQINLHLYFDKIKDKDLIKVLIFKSKRKFNPLVVMLLREHIQKQKNFCIRFSIFTIRRLPIYSNQ